MSYDIVVIGAGHAGTEAALACARMGQKTLLLTLDLDSVGLMPCNPAIGGTGKGHLVREIDALGGEMALAADDTLIQMRMLNTGKGPAVHSLRAQMDKRRYHERMIRALQTQENLTLAQGEVTQLPTKNGCISGVVTAEGTSYSCRAVVLAAGVYLKSRTLIGDDAWESGPAGLARSEGLSAVLTGLGLSLQRFKTGTPARVSRESLDLSQMQIQPGDDPMPAFSFLNGPRHMAQEPCYLTYTNAQTHRIILDNLHRSPLYSGKIHAAATRYCPSIEDKVVKFADKDRHQIFIEPEGLTTSEMYVQGMSTSLPADVQIAMLRTLPGLARCEILRLGYAIEYDCLDPTVLNAALMVKSVSGLFTAGQINGSSGYEEAAAQGLLAGINAARWARGEEPFLLSRSDAYLGVLVDDLVTRGTAEPYRMMTSRCEYRLLLRQDNADLRLTERARATGLICQARYDKLVQKQDSLNATLQKLDTHVAPTEALNTFLASLGEPAPKTGVRLFDLLKRPKVRYADLLRLFDRLEALAPEVEEQVNVLARYDGYIQKQREQVAREKALENEPLPEDIDYGRLSGLRLEARQKLNAIRPRSIGQASRISGVNPADVSVLLIHVKKGFSHAGTVV
ncbi:MAG: tRNA uridine-5-carboxymethylaminomethyl(34) synthesis enzyme MnmG [Clostridiales bacterium]|nr:tRNA uridine-5-carboxymethylaminomethyl(34) synthesis enzyme MnmG [Clostridiales bacterium]